MIVLTREDVVKRRNDRGRESNSVVEKHRESSEGEQRMKADKERRGKDLVLVLSVFHSWPI
jgi:hypothetical protein